MRRIISFIKKEAMLTVSITAALISLLITPPDASLLKTIDWKTLVTLFMLLSVLDGFKHENLFTPLLRKAGKISSMCLLTFFFVFSVFFSSMFVTNDVSLIIFVPLTIILFRSGNKEKYTISTLVLENIAAVRGSLLTPFGSPQNLFLFGQSGLSASSFMKMMLPLWIGSFFLLSLFILFMYRKDIKEKIVINEDSFDKNWKLNSTGIVYLVLFVVIVATIVSRTSYWMYVAIVVVITLLIADRNVFTRVDYALLGTFFCFFVFSSSIAANPGISSLLQKTVRGNEYFWSLGLSQIISNVPAAIVLWPFTDSLRGLIYGLDSAGLISIIGSLASVINMRLYTKEYPGKGMAFMASFEKICLIFFAIIVVPQYLII